MDLNVCIGKVKWLMSDNVVEFTTVTTVATLSRSRQLRHVTWLNKNEIDAHNECSIHIDNKMFYVSVKLVSSTSHCSEFHSSKFADKAAIRYSQNEPLNIYGLAYNH